MANTRIRRAPSIAGGELTADHLKTILHYDPETGVFTRIKRTSNRVALGSVCDYLNTNGYIQISVENRLYLATHLAVLYMTGSLPKGIVDHKDTVKTNNRWANLRDTNLNVNAQNIRVARCTNQSGFLGVSPCGKRWAATIMVNKKKRHIGLFATPELASAAYLAAKRELHPGNTL